MDSNNKELSEKEIFPASDWISFQNIIKESTNNTLDSDRLYIIWDSLPQNIKEEALQWGMKDAFVSIKIASWAAIHLKHRGETEKM